MGGVTATVVFPSVEWFQRLADLMAEDVERFKKLGETDCTMIVRILDGTPDGTPWNVQITFEEFAVTSVEEVDDSALEQVDFVLETDRESWEAMVENISSNNGRPDLDFTLNGLSMAGTPIRCWSVDPLRRDAFFRFNQSIQQFVNNCARL